MGVHVPDRAEQEPSPGDDKSAQLASKLWRRGRRAVQLRALSSPAGGSTCVEEAFRLAVSVLQ